MVLVEKNLPANAGATGDSGLIPESGRSPGRGHDNPLQYSCLENPMNRGTYQATVCGLQRVEHDWATNTFGFHSLVVESLKLYMNQHDRYHSDIIPCSPVACEQGHIKRAIFVEQQSVFGCGPLFLFYIYCICPDLLKLCTFGNLVVLPHSYLSLLFPFFPCWKKDVP